MQSMTLDPVETNESTDSECCPDCKWRGEYERVQGFLRQISSVCRQAALGNLEARILHIDQCTGNDKDLIEVLQGINSLLDYSEAFVREAKAVLSYAADEKYFRRVVLTGTNGAFRQASELINDASEQMKCKSDEIDRAKRQRLEMADSFEATVKGITDSLLQATNHLQEISTNLSGTAQQTSDRSQNALQTAAQSVDNVREVTRSADQLQQAMGEIDQKMDDTSRRVHRVVEEIADAKTVMDMLGKSSSSIDNVVETIEEVARQTHLLSFNAAIEAARSGTAGSGFAVVASEVRNLAERTKIATQQVKDEIQQVQSHAENAVESINQFGLAIEQLDQTSGAVSKLISDQTETTSEIRSNVEQAMKCTESVNENIRGVSGAASQTNAATARLTEASTELERQSSALSKGVETLLAQIRSDA